MMTKNALTEVLSRLTHRFNLKVALPVTFSVCLVLVAAHWVGKIPKPLIVVVGATFGICSAVFWGVRRKTQNGAPPAIVYKQVTQLLLAWILTTTLLLGSVYYIDRAGWLWLRLTGYDVTLAEDLSNRVDLSIADFVEQHPSFVIDPQDSTKLILPRGEYEFKKTTVVPRGSSLTIEPGTILRFGAGRSLISYSPVIARGTENQPILFTARSVWLKWGVVGLVEASPSVFEYVRFEHGRQALVTNVDFTGSLSLIDTDAEIKHSQFVNLFGKDGVYVRRGHVLIQENVFRNTYKDGLDLDAGSGQITDNEFVNCGDEGIDLSENYDVQVFKNRILDSRGGRVSADHDLEQIKSLNILGYVDND
jgi:hypothetical protein